VPKPHLERSAPQLALGCARAATPFRAGRLCAFAGLLSGAESESMAKILWRFGSAVVMETGLVEQPF